VYIHCKLLSWDPEVLSESQKACHYVKENERWELLDDPMQSSMCDCCSRTCNTRSKRGDEWESNGFMHTSVLGPLIIMDPSQQNAHNASDVSIADQGALLLSLAAAMAVYADMKVDCGPEFVTLMWRESRPQADTSLLRLGNCFPTSFSAGVAFFYVDLTDCNFRRLVTGDALVYSNDLTYVASADSYNLAFTHPVVCAYERPKDWYATIYDPVFKTYSLGDLQFNIGLMNGPAESTRFPLGSIIPIMASVVQETHQPLLLLLEECVAATTPELYPESTMYPIISNKGNMECGIPQAPTVAAPSKASDIHYPEEVLSIHDSQQYQGVGALVVEVQGPRICRSLDHHVLPINGTNTIGKVPTLLEPSSNGSPVLHLWYRHGLLNQGGPDGTRNLLHDDSHCCMPDPIAECYGPVRVTGCQVP
ncbi:hypothetical protein JOQ06_000149, partial [Pogonophryne albipinna]